MEIILKENVANVGFKDEVVTVKPGYGRNYLLKTGKALRFNKENLNYVSKKLENPRVSLASSVSLLESPFFMLGKIRQKPEVKSNCQRNLLHHLSPLGSGKN